MAHFYQRPDGVVIIVTSMPDDEDTWMGGIITQENGQEHVQAWTGIVEEITARDVHPLVLVDRATLEAALFALERVDPAFHVRGALPAQDVLRAQELLRLLMRDQPQEPERPVLVLYLCNACRQSLGEVPPGEASRLPDVCPSCGASVPKHLADMW